MPDEDKVFKTNTAWLRLKNKVKPLSTANLYIVWIDANLSGKGGSKLELYSKELQYCSQFYE